METFKDSMATRGKEENIRKTAKKELQELNQLAATIQVLINVISPGIF